MHIRRVGVGVDGAYVVLTVVADFIAGAVGVMRAIRLYPLGVLVYVVIVPVLSVYVPASIVCNVVLSQ